MARNRASMREGPLAELFRATEAAQRQAKQAPESAARADARGAAGADGRARSRLREGGAARRCAGALPSRPRRL